MLVRAATDDDRRWIGEVLRARWGGPDIVVHDRLLDALALPALIAEADGQRCGLATYERRGAEWELVTLDALEQYCGVGTALVDTLADLARAHGAQCLLVMTTNDNVDALRFYQRRGFVVSGVRPGAIEESRRLKPSIPPTGCHGIPIRDEIELVRQL